jgi:8-amino-7-oxononanoate synthase
VLSMDVFEKCRRFYSEAAFAQKLGYPVNPRMAQALGLYPYFLPVEESEDSTIVVDGRTLIMLGSNNYLGLNGDHRVKQAACRAIKRYGTGCTGSRFLNGTLELHLELEEKLAAYVGKPKALVFSTGFQVNLGVLTALAGPGDLIVCDKGVHASIVDAVFLARSQRRAELRFFRHRDLESLARILDQSPPDQARLVVTDGVFSMEGDVAPVKELVDMCRHYSARLFLDDAHGIGVLGGGRGTAAHFGCSEATDLIGGTFSKSLASMGGFVASEPEVIHWIEHRARAYMFTASLAPGSVAAAIAALEIMQQEPNRIDRVLSVSRRMRLALSDMGFDVGRSETPIVPVIIGDQFKTMQAWETLWKAGVYVNVALPPAVPAKSALLRTSYMATHTEEQLAHVLEAFEAVKRKITWKHNGKEMTTEHRSAWKGPGEKISGTNGNRDSR